MSRRDAPAIWEAYTDVDRSKSCPGCGAAANSWCTRGDGRVRRVPCPRRPRNPLPLARSRSEGPSVGLPSPAAPSEPLEGESAARTYSAPTLFVDFSAPRHEREDS